MAITNIKVESRETESDPGYLEYGEITDKHIRVMEMRLVAQNKNKASITNNNDKRTEDIKAPFSEIVKTGAEGNQGDIVI